MRRTVIVTPELDDEIDERAMQFDIRTLDDGDRLYVFIERERRWERGTFRISTAGDAIVDVRGYDSVLFEKALAMGIRRVLH